MNSDLRLMDVQYLAGVGPKRAELLRQELGIATFHDLLYYFPFRYVDRSTIHHISEIDGDMPYIQLRGRFVTFNALGEGRRRRLQALFTDGTGTIEVVWFNRIKSIQENYHTGVDYLIFGKPTQFQNHYNIVHPEVDLFKPETAPQGLQGVYSLTEKLTNRQFSSRTMQRLVGNLLKTPAAQHVAETLPRHLLAQRGLMPLPQALASMHLPATVRDLQRAQFRMKYEELFFLQLNIIKYIKGREERRVGFVFGHVGDYFNNFYNHVLPFPLTGAQKRVIREMRRDMGSGRQMNRLL
ncbi:MAG: ATP-dependent DNA helicase RecG, partial [Muribaculaceae bacterium]|nr:ATP-dependent DNA helicase RecG [Muribaculaceae bacterium]